MENEPELQRDFLKKMQKIAHQKTIKVKNFAKRYGLIFAIFLRNI